MRKHSKVHYIPPPINHEYNGHIRDGNLWHYASNGTPTHTACGVRALGFLGTSDYARVTCLRCL